MAKNKQPRIPKKVHAKASEIAQAIFRAGDTPPNPSLHVIKRPQKPKDSK